MSTTREAESAEVVKKMMTMRMAIAETKAGHG